MTIGFIGTGNITTAVVTGLCTAEPAPSEVLLSPRNAAKAAALAAAFAAARVAPDNQAVVEGSDWVVLAVRPPVARRVIGELAFRPRQRVVSLIASLPLAELRDLCAPAAPVVRAVPLPPVARHAGPIAVYPADAETVALFGRIGAAVAVDDERQFHALGTVTATVAAYYAFLARIAGWLADAGVEKGAAQRYVGAVAEAVAVDANKAAKAGFDALIADVATPGGMNEQVLRIFTDCGGFDPIKPALDAVLDRHERAP